METFLYHAGLVLFGLTTGVVVGYFHRRNLEKRLNRNLKREVLLEFERRTIPARIPAPHFERGRFAT